MAKRKNVYIDDSLKKTFWRKFYALSVRLGDGIGLYRGSTRFLHLLFGRHSIQYLVYRRRPHLFRQLLEEIGIPETLREKVVQQVLAEDFKDRLDYDGTILDVSTPEILNNIIFEQDTVHFERARRTGRGIILLGLYHGPRLNFWVRYLANFTVPVYVFNQSLDRKHFLELDREQERIERAIVHLGELREMQRILKDGGVVWINPEGGKGTKGVEMPLFRRKMLFRTGFVELALRTNAILLPLTGRKLKNGDIHLTFRPPYSQPPDGMNHDEAARFLLAQHIEMIEKLWCQYPGQINYRAGVRHINVFPLIENDGN